MLLFSDDPQQEMLINAMRDYSFGVNNGRFAYMNGDNGDPYIQYTYDNKKYNITPSLSAIDLTPSKYLS